jgi:hypothetical protein
VRSDGDGIAFRLANREEVFERGEEMILGPILADICLHLLVGRGADERDADAKSDAFHGRGALAAREICG